MPRISIFGCVLAVILCGAMRAEAEQQVSLRNGTTLVGNVSMDGENLVVEVDGGKIAVPFKDVANVATTKTGGANQAHRLVLRSLEAQVLSDGENEELGLLAEAFQLAPDDPHVAFWYARGLANAGFGKGASDVFAPRREAIAAAYPGVANRLAKQIEERVLIESLPATLVRRLDQFAAASKNHNPGSNDEIPYAAYFRIVDQADAPIERSAFNVNSSGSDEKLESFSDGYYFYTFNRRNHMGDEPCRLEVSQPGLVSKTFEFQGGAESAENVGVLRVERLSEADRKPVVVKVVDAQGKPLAGATVAFHAFRSQGGASTIPPVTTNAEGEAKLTLYPSQYSCQISRNEYYPASENLTISRDAKEATQIDAKLHLAIRAKVKVAWRSEVNQPGMPQFGDGAATTGEFEMTAESGRPGQPPGGGMFGPPWVQLVQQGDTMKLSFQEFGHFPQARGGSWVVRLPRGAEEKSADAKPDESIAQEDAEMDMKADVELFNLMNLEELDMIAREAKVERTTLGGRPGMGQPAQVPIERGDIFIGRVNSRDPSNGRPAILEFKILVTDLFRP